MRTIINAQTGEVTIDEDFVAPPPSIPSQSELDAANTLTRPRFEAMLALRRGDPPVRWQKVWADITAWAYDNDDNLYAQLCANATAPTLRLSVTLTMLEGLRLVLAQIAPNVDLSEATVREAWAAAKVFDLTGEGAP